MSMVAEAFNLSTGEAGVTDSLRIPGQPGLCSKFQASQIYIIRYCLKN